MLCFHAPCRGRCLACQVEQLGALTSTDRDESHNKIVKRVYRSVQSGTARMLTKLSILTEVRSGSA